MKIDFWKIVIVCGLKSNDYLRHVKKSGKTAVPGDVWLEGVRNLHHSALMIAE
jgi:hypothetical protein